MTRRRKAPVPSSPYAYPRKKKKKARKNRMKGIKMITNRRRFELIYVVRGSSYACTGSGRTRLFACTDRTPVCNVGTRGTRIISSLDSSPGVYTYTSGSYTIDIVQRSYSFRHGAKALGWTGVRQQYTLICCHRTLSCVCVVAFSSLTKVLGEGWHIQSLPAFFFPFFFFLKWRLVRAH